MRLESKDKYYPCPECGENWCHGWESVNELKEFLRKRSIWRCVKCKNIFRDGILQ